MIVTLIVLASTACIAALVAWRLGAFTKKTPAPTTPAPTPAPTQYPTPVHVVAQPPARRPTKSDMALARLINTIDADMRSIELGRWFVYSLATRLYSVRVCSDALRYDFAGIARRVPGANAVTQREIQKHLEAIMRLAMASCPNDGNPRPSLGRALERMELSAFGINGTLRGMPGYANKSRLPLPDPWRV